MNHIYCLGKGCPAWRNGILWGSHWPSAQKTGRACRRSGRQASSSSRQRNKDCLYCYWFYYPHFLFFFIIRFYLYFHTQRSISKERFHKLFFSFMYIVICPAWSFRSLSRHDWRPWRHRNTGHSLKYKVWCPTGACDLRHFFSAQRPSWQWRLTESRKDSQRFVGFKNHFPLLFITRAESVWKREDGSAGKTREEKDQDKRRRAGASFGDNRISLMLFQILP